MFNSIRESVLYSVEDKEVNMREMAFADSLDELNTSSTTNDPQLTGNCFNREYYVIKIQEFVSNEEW